MRSNLVGTIFSKKLEWENKKEGEENNIVISFTVEDEPL